MSENNCTSPEKTDILTGRVVFVLICLSHLCCLSCCLYPPLSVYLIFAACHAVFIHLSLAKWALMGSWMHLTLLFCFLWTTVLCEWKIKEWRPVIYYHHITRSVFSLAQTEISSLPYTHITLYILFLTLIVCLKWSQYHSSSSNYQVHMRIFIIIWKWIKHLLICFKCPPWCAYYFCFILHIIRLWRV